MRKKLFSILGAWILFAGLAVTASAQNLYLSNMDVRYKNGGNGYCNDVVGSDPAVSFLTAGGNVWNNSSLIEFERPRSAYPGACLGLCATISCVNTSTEAFGVDELTFEVFKFAAGANPLDQASTPPIKTIPMHDIASCPGSASGGSIGTYCTSWDGSYNLNGMFGKTNGQFGFRAKVKTNQVSATAGNISIEQTSAFPGTNQIPIQVNVTNIHSLRSTPTVVGRFTGVAAQPYNILYRLSKDAIVNINVYDANTAGTLPLVRTIISDTPRIGEGTPDGTLTNGDYWDGRDGNGELVPGGNYLVRIEAQSNDAWQPPTDLAFPATMQMSLDPLQITDVAIKPLGASATDMATISYMLTEPATVYVEIYTPGTQFADVNVSPVSVVAGTGSLLKRFKEEKESRKAVITYWDGRDESGSPVCDGNYVYAVYAVLPGASGARIWTMRTNIGVVPVARGPVLAFMSPSSTVVGSSPSASGIDPFYFKYTPVRTAYVTLNIKKMDGQTLVRNVVKNKQASANYATMETWDGKDDNGLFVASGTYLSELVTTDPFVCSTLKTSTMTVPIDVNMFRVVDVKTSPLLVGSSSDVVSATFTLSKTMFVEFNVYPTNVVIPPSPWPPTGLGVPVYSVQSLLSGLKITTEFWDGRDAYGRMLPDGHYPFTLVAHSTGTAQVVYASDPVYGYVDIARGQIIFNTFDVIPSIPTMYNSSDTVKLPPYEVDYVLSRQALTTVDIMTLTLPSTVVANVVANRVCDGDTICADFWDGKDSNGNFVTGGEYNVRVTAQDVSAQLTTKATAQMTIDVYPLRIYDVAITPLTVDNPAVVNYQVSETMKVVTKIYKPGTWFDTNGVAYPPEATSLVKRMIGVRPARTNISENWDGTDLTLTRVPDGNYVFKVYGSTNTGGISSLTGDLSTGTVLADDIITANVPVTRGTSADLCGDFSKGTFFAPNPYVGTSGWFHIPVLKNGRVTLKVYNLAADLVFKNDFGLKGQDEDIKYTWAKVNSAGKAVAPGVYFAVVRFEGSEGTREVCQVVKKILVPSR